MPQEKECKPSERYLTIFECIPASEIQLWKDRIKPLSIYLDGEKENKHKTDLYKQIIKWRKKDNKLVVVSSYAYADIPLPKKINCVFEIDKPEIFRSINACIVQAVWEMKHPIDFIESGHCHDLVLEFDKDVDDLFLKLPSIGEKETQKVKLGLCDYEDYISIRDRIKKVAELRRLYGIEYWKYDEDK